MKTLTLLTMVACARSKFNTLHSALCTSQRPKRNGLSRQWRKVYLAPLGVQRLIGWLPGRRVQPVVQFANIAEGTHGHGTVSYLPDGNIGRYNVVKVGSDDSHVAKSGANTDQPLGVTTDDFDFTNTPDLAGNVAVLGACKGTQKVVAGGNIAVGDLLQSNGDGTAIKLKTTAGTWWVIGRAIRAGAANDIIEFAPTLPYAVVI